MNYRKFFCSIIVGLFAGCLVFEAAAQINIKVEAGPSKSKAMVLKPQVKIPFSGQEQIIKELDELIRFDLTFSNALYVIPETPKASFISQQDNESNAIHYDDWAQLQ